MSRHTLSDDIEELRDLRWRREGARQVESAHDAEQFVEQVGFAACLTDSRKPGPSLYVAVCGRRDAVMPRNVQKDPEASHTWLLKDDVIRRGKVYYANVTDVGAGCDGRRGARDGRCQGGWRSRVVLTSRC